MGVSSLQHDSPFAVLALGVATFLGCVGLGLALFRSLNWRLPSPWRQVGAVCLGVDILSLAVQIVAISGAATRGVLIGTWGALIGAGLVYLISTWSWGVSQAASNAASRAGIAWLLPAAALLLLLLMSLAPSTRNDEIYYHMVTPARIVAEHRLRFFRQPWEGAIVSQMGHQIAAAPLHALAFPDASNVLSVCMVGMFAWFAGKLIAAQSGKPAWGAVASAVLLVGMSATTTYPAAGPHALGDLACAALVLVAIFLDDLRLQAPPLAIIGLVSILAVTGASTKVVFLPLCFGLSVYLFIRMTRQKDRHLNAPAAFLALGIPWALFYLPLFIWTWAQSGSPFGPLLAGRLGASAYDVPQIRGVLAEVYTHNLMTLKEAALTIVLHYSPAMWIGAALFFFTGAIPAGARRVGAALLIGQALLVAIFLTQSPRFLAAIPAALFIAWAARAPATGPAYRGLVAGAAALVLPWLALGAFYGRQFFPPLLGGAHREQFLADKIPLLRDYRALDKLLPPDAVLLTTDNLRIDAVYSPRLMVLDPADIPPRRPVFQLICRYPGSLPPLHDLKGWTTGETVYEDPAAVVQAFRTPGRPPLIGEAKVVRLER